MTKRKDLLTASRVDLILILLPIIGHLDAVFALVDSGVPLEVAARVLATPEERRAILDQQSIGSDQGDRNHPSPRDLDSG
jgi:hypothetical protein